MPEYTDHLSEQQVLIYKLIMERESITSAEAEKLLGVKRRRARAILKKMVENGIIIKTGASQATRL